MLTLLTALALTASTGGLGALDAVADGGVPNAVGDSGLTVSTVESGLVDPADPLLEDLPPMDPPPEDPPPEEMPEGDPPQITGFLARVMPGNMLVVEGVVVDEDPPTCTVEIDWLDVGYTATPNGDGSFIWYVGLEEGDTGWVTAVAVDSMGLESPPVKDLITP